MSIEPDTKDWTWVLERPCPECGFAARAIDRAALPGLLRDTAVRWRAALTTDDCAVRPADNIWSPLEYACHVRDVHRVFDERLRLLLTEGDPAFANWDQDTTAVEARYDLQDPATVADELAVATETVADRYAGAADDAWERTGTRSDGAVFTVESLGRYQLHDVVHHLADVGS
jgi:DinB superfamily